MTYRVRDWNNFQHFKDRRPPWIKLYRDILDDPDWHDLDPANAKALVMLWLMASESKAGNGELPALRRIAFRLRTTEEKAEQVLAELSHWVICDDIGVTSKRYQDDAPETETETETEGEGEPEGAPTPAGSCPDPDTGTGNVIPQVEDLIDYAVSVGYAGFDVDAAHCFLDYYTARGWMVSGTPICSWQAVLRTWKTRDSGTYSKVGGGGTGQGKRWDPSDRI